MRVAITTAGLSRECGGPVQKIRRLYPALVEQGVDVTVITSTLTSKGKGEAATGPGTFEGIPVIRLPTPYIYRFSPLVFWRDVPGFDVLHVLGAWNGVSYAALSAGPRTAGATVWEPVGNLVARGRFPYLKRGLRPVHEWLLKRCDGVIWTSKREREESDAVPSCPSFFRPNPCDPEDLSDLPGRDEARAQLGLSGSTPLWGYLGRIDRRKGIDGLLRAWPGPSAGRLVFAGPVGDPELGRAVADHGRGVIALGEVSAQERWRYLRALDALVLVPVFGENFGNVVIEAMQVGTPVVASSAVGCLDWIDDPGVLVVDGDDELRRVLRAGPIPPATRGLPDACLAPEVAALQHDIYRQVLKERTGPAPRRLGT